MTTLPSIETLDVPRECDYCGGPVVIVDPVYCEPCAERLALEKVVERGNEYRRQAQIRLDLYDAAIRARRHQASKAEPESCIRWGSGPDRCVRHFDHTGVCREASGETTLTLAAKALAKPVPPQHTCAVCEGSGSLYAGYAGDQPVYEDCQDCRGTGVIA